MASTFKFRLYVAGNSPNSVQAIANLNAFCREFLPERLIRAAALTLVRAQLPSERIRAAGISQLLPKPATIHSRGAAVRTALSPQPN